MKPILKSGLIAKDIHRSVLPATFDAFSRDVGMGCEFEIFNVNQDELAQTVENARNTLDGFVVTMPYKCRILDFVDEVAESAEQCGSCNIVKVDNGRLIAHNTDGWGFVKALSLKGVDIAGMRVTMVGAGGVAMSLAYNLKLAGVRKVDVLNAFPDETARLCSRFGELFVPHELNAQNLRECARGTDLFLNASVLGQVGYPEYEDLSFLDGMGSDAVVFDVNYSKPDALLPAAAKERGMRSYVGRCMSACQGIRAMEIWTGKTPSDACAVELVNGLEGQGISK